MSVLESLTLCNKTYKVRSCIGPETSTKCDSSIGSMGASVVYGRILLTTFLAHRLGVLRPCRTCPPESHLFKIIRLNQLLWAI